MESTTNMSTTVQQVADSPACIWCHRDALVVDASGTTLCAHHATIFITAGRSASRRPSTSFEVRR
jgi:hypothetical protein